MGLDSSVLWSEVSFGHFGTGAEMSGHFGPTGIVPKCLSANLSWVRSVRLLTSFVNEMDVGVAYAIT